MLIAYAHDIKEEIFIPIGKRKKQTRLLEEKSNYHLQKEITNNILFCVTTCCVWDCSKDGNIKSVLLPQVWMQN